MFKMSTSCGIPWIELQGNEHDWVSLRHRAVKLGTLLMPAFATTWMNALLPVLDEFVDAYQGKVNYEFWQSMVKRIQHGMGSGSFSSISGWINVFYPYLEEGKENPYLKPWREMLQSDGPELSDFPSIFSSAPVEWDYNGTLLKLHCHAGMMGAIQDEHTLALRPHISWVVTHDPPMEPTLRIAQLEKELASIRACGDVDYTTRYWIDRAEKELASLRK